MPIVGVLRCDPHSGGAADPRAQGHPRGEQRLLPSAAVWRHEGGQPGTVLIVPCRFFFKSTVYLLMRVVQVNFSSYN